MPEEREVLDVDVLFVGAGPASLVGAIHLANLLQKQGVKEPNIAVIEKGKEMGAHAISGAVYPIIAPRCIRQRAIAVRSSSVRPPPSIWY